MGYFYMSNINNFNNVNSPVDSYQQIGVYQNDSSDEGIIDFKDKNIKQKANFIMIRAHGDNDLLVQLYPSEYGVYIPAGELWSVDSLNEIEKIIVRKIISASTGNTIIPTDNNRTPGKIQWVIGYK